MGEQKNGEAKSQRQQPLSGDDVVGTVKKPAIGKEAPDSVPASSHVGHVASWPSFWQPPTAQEAKDSAIWPEVAHWKEPMGWQESAAGNQKPARWMPASWKELPSQASTSVAADNWRQHAFGSEIVEDTLVTESFRSPEVSEIRVREGDCYTDTLPSHSLGIGTAAGSASVGATTIAERSTPSGTAWAPSVSNPMDEVTRQLLQARDKIEAVELEFAQVMGELAAYGDRLPMPSTQPQQIAFSEPLVGQRPAPLAACSQSQPEHFCIDTPSAANFHLDPLDSCSPIAPVSVGWRQRQGRTIA